MSPFDAEADLDTFPVDGLNVKECPLLTLKRTPLAGWVSGKSPLSLKRTPLAGWASRNEAWDISQGMCKECLFLAIGQLRNIKLKTGRQNLKYNVSLFSGLCFLFSGMGGCNAFSG
jgi:hypothetical protein